jgi:hypothetical protein
MIMANSRVRFWVSIRDKVRIQFLGVVVKERVRFRAKLRVCAGLRLGIG